MDYRASKLEPQNTFIHWFHSCKYLCSVTGIQNSCCLLGMHLLLAAALRRNSRQKPDSFWGQRIWVLWICKRNGSPTKYKCKVCAEPTEVSVSPDLAHDYEWEVSGRWRAGWWECLDSLWKKIKINSRHQELPKEPWRGSHRWGLMGVRKSVPKRTISSSWTSAY